jgi:hypothetical protein
MTIRFLDELPPDERLAASVAVVGAGPAGITLALELASRSIDVILLEGGSEEFDERSQRRYEGTLQPSETLVYPPPHAWRLRMLGGTSNHWGGWCRRLESNVFDDRPWLGGVAWPFDRAELESGYSRAHDLCELGRDVYDSDVVQSDLGLTRWPDLDRTGLESSIWRYSTPTLFGERYRGELESGALDVILRANVIAFETNGRAVKYISVLGDDGALRSVQADVVVLTTGGLESVRQLLHLEAASQLDVNASGWLGSGFMEHPHGVVGNVIIDPDLAVDPTGPLAILLQRRPDVDGIDVRAGLTVSPAVCEERRLPNMSFTVDPVPAQDDELRNLPSGAAVSELVELITAGRAGLPHRIYMRSEQRLERTSRVTLSNDVDDLGLRRIHLDWRVAPQDLLDAVTGVQMIASAFAGLGIALVHSRGARSPLVGLTGGGHHIGGARMHEDASQGVVDPELRVHGSDNLFVCSSSVFPAGGYSNPTLTIVALAHRLAGTLSA